MRNFEIKNQNGRSMIEMLGVLAIIGVLSVGGIAGYSKAMMKYRINKTIEQITLIAGNIRAFWGPQKNYHGLGIDDDIIARKAKLVPDEMIEYNQDGSFKQFTNVFGEKVNFSVRSRSSVGDVRAFQIRYTLPRDEEICIELMSQDWTSANASNVQIVDNFFKVPVALDDAVTACSSAIAATAANPAAFTLFISFDVDEACNTYENCRV